MYPGLKNLKIFTYLIFSCAVSDSEGTGTNPCLCWGFSGRDGSLLLQVLRVLAHFFTALYISQNPKHFIYIPCLDSKNGTLT